jgi:hypothetical protein
MPVSFGAQGRKMMMRNTSTLGLMATTLLALQPAIAWAQETPGETAPPAEGEPAATATATGEAGVEATGAAAAPEVATAAVTDEAPAPRWPRAVIARPLTLPGAVFQAGLDQGANNDFSAMSSKLVAGYGINDKLEATAFYAFASKEFEAKGALDVNVGYAAVRGAMGGKLEVVPRAQLGYNFFAEGLNPLLAGAQAQYNATDKIALITPGGQLSVALEGEEKPVTFGLPVAVGIQATPELYVQVDTLLGTLKIADAENAFIFADSTPVLATGIYNVMPALDVLAAFGLNATPADDASVGDTLSFLAGLRYYGGTL